MAEGQEEMQEHALAVEALSTIVDQPSQLAHVVIG